MNALERSFVYCSVFRAFFESLTQWRGACGAVGLSSLLTQQEYDVLLKGADADVFIPLWASCSKGKGKPLLDETTRDVVRFYKRLGHAPLWMDGNPPDYLGEQFRFLSYLYACAGKDPAYAREAEAFETLYTVDTVKTYGDALRKHGAGTEAAALLQMMEAHLAKEAADPPMTPQCRALLAEMAAILPGEPLAFEQERVINSAGLNNCGGKCKINITVAEGCALSIHTDQSDNAPQIRACVRGRGYRHTFLNPTRLRYPMKRIGERGEGKFCRITWAEAAAEIAQTTLRLGRAYGPESRFVIYSTGNCGVMRADTMAKRLLNLDGGYLAAYNSYSTACSTYVAPFIYGDAYGGNSERDMLNSKLLILWGHNPSETIFGSLRNYYLAEAKAKGIPIVVIDPRASDTVLALADEWVPIRPTTDGALADAMAYVIVTNKLHDEAFLSRFCVGFDSGSLPAGIPKEESYLAYLMGEKDGIPKTPAWASGITGAPAETIERLARRYATTKPAAILPGYGPQRNGNGEQGTRSIAALACLTANVGKSGGSAGTPGFRHGPPKPEFPIGDAPYPGVIPQFLWFKAIEQGTSFTQREDGLKGVDHLNANIKMIFNLASNILINQHSDINNTIRILKDTSKCELIVVYDIFMTASARFADILLPATSLLEGDNMAAPWSNEDYLLSNRRAVGPLFECLPDYDFMRKVAREMGLEREFTAGRETTQDWLKELYEKVCREMPGYPPYELFRDNGGFQSRDPPLQVAYKDNIEKGKPFATPSGKIELFSKTLYDMGQPGQIPAVPSYVPCPEGPEDFLRERYPLQMVGYHTKRRCHSIHDNNDWMEEIDPPALWMHPQDARERGIRDGDMIEVYNDRGRVRIPAKVTDRIMQGVTAMSQGGWYTPDKDGADVRGSINVLTHAHSPTPLAKGNPQHTNLVEVRKAAHSDC